MSPRVLAVCGKGGVGKTTVSAVLAGALIASGERKTLLVDADPAGGLALALGLPVARSLDQVRTETIHEVQKGQTDAQDLAISLDYRLLQALVERKNLAFLAIGRPESVGCYCSVNSLLRQAIELLAGQFDLTVIDAEAGIEQINRKVMAAVDYLVLVSDASYKGLQVAETIFQVARKVTGQDKAGLLLNRVRSAEQAGQIQARTGLKMIGWIPEDETIRQFDSEPRSFFDLPECPAAKAIVEALTKAGIIK
jgi:CO dehydrogenase maturation factor